MFFGGKSSTKSAYSIVKQQPRINIRIVNLLKSIHRKQIANDEA